MKAIFEYDNGKKYHANVSKFIEKSKTSVRYILSSGDWKEGVRIVSQEVVIDPVRSGLVSITVYYSHLGANSPTARTIYTFKQQPKQKIKNKNVPSCPLAQQSTIDTEVLEKAIKKVNKVVPGVRYRSSNNDSKVYWFVQDSTVYCTSLYKNIDVWASHEFPTVESLKKAVDSGELVVYEE